MITAAVDWTSVPAGLVQPDRDAQAIFRVVLQAMAMPGHVRALPSSAIDSIGLPRTATAAPWPVGMAAIALSLLDGDTPTYLHGTLDRADARAWLRFHAGVATQDDPARAAFWLARMDELTTLPWGELDLGTDMAPQDSTTLCMEVDALGSPTEGATCGSPAGSVVLHLRGPGIAADPAAVRRLSVAGLPGSFWAQREAGAALYPRGYDLILTCGPCLTALPRTTRVELA